MKKEVFLAVLVGFILGLVITFGIWTANKNLKPKISSDSAIPAPTQAAPTSVPSQPSTLSLTVASPEDELFTNSSTLTVSGSTSPLATIIILTESDELTTVANDKGAFSVDFELEGGYNRLTITAFDSNGNTASKQFVVTYSTTKI